MVRRFLSCDWGTSSFRLRLVQTADGLVLAESLEGTGIADTNEACLRSGCIGDERMDFYKNILLSQIRSLNRKDLEDVPVVISGMASSSIGIAELKYQEIPFSIYDDNLNFLRLARDQKFPHEVLLVSGLKSKTDAMRGEESILLGCGINDAEEYLLIFPGTHSKHIWVKNKTLTVFKTFMTGELFELLSRKSILSKSVEPNERDQYQNIFIRGVVEGSESNLLHTLFHVRTSHLFKTLSAAENYHYLSGLLIGTELKEIPSEKLNIILVCNEKLYSHYWTALQMLCRDSHLNFMHADQCLVNGHCKLVDTFF